MKLDGTADLSGDRPRLADDGTGFDVQRHDRVAGTTRLSHWQSGADAMVIYAYFPVAACMGFACQALFHAPILSISAEPRGSPPVRGTSRYDLVFGWIRRGSRP